MTTPFDQARNIRDRRLRRWLLRLLYDARGSEGGRLSGAMLHDLLGYAVSGSEAPEDSQHTLRMLRDLVNAGFADERDTRRMKDERFSLAVLEFGITADGTALLEMQREASPLVEDDRR